MLEILVLGPLEARQDGKVVALPRQMHRALLALLALRANEVVSTDRLIEELWDGKPPATAKDALQNYVSQLRKALGRDAIVTRAPGYLLEIPPEHTDVGRFEQLLARARATDDAEQRAALLRDALSLWRGPALADLAYEAFAAPEAARLDEARAVAREDLVDAELALGRHTELVAELEDLVESHPYDERARAQLMLALYRSGRQAEALEAFQDARRALADALGLEPSPALRELERAILLQEPSLVSGDAEVPGEGERRKTVTVLSAELLPRDADDPEQERAAIVRAVAVARAAIEQHEGWIAARAGDELLGVFGVPTSHEDDALRAVRAAAELRGALAADGAIEVRLGVDTGEVLTGHGFVTGDVLRSAARLWHGAEAGEIVVGTQALGLVRHAVDGRSARDGFRLESVTTDVPAVFHSVEAPFVGRDDELDRLLGAVASTHEAGRGRFVAIVGEPGIGKSRLVSELRARIDATVCLGRCLAYGEAAAYTPLREALAQLDVVDELPDQETLVSVDEWLLAVRQALVAVAAERPLVVVLEDLHWGEERLLDFVDQLAQAPAPILVLGTGRPELLDARPGWRDDYLGLVPLSEADTHALVATFEAGVEPEMASRVAELAEGNPLFAGQLIAYVGELGDHAVELVPPTVDALLAARLDLLDADVRATTQRAAVVGREFTREALDAIATSPSSLSDHVLELVRRGLVLPATGSQAKELYRFHHVLVREVAYASLPKTERAGLHETYADWLAVQADADDEVIGYHLEQAYDYRTELAPADRRAKQLAADAGARLGAAGMRSWRRADVPSTIDLLGRAASLLPDGDPWRRELLCELGVAFDAAGSTAQAEKTLVAGLGAAEAALDVRITHRAQLELALVRLRREPEGRDEAVLDAVAGGVPVFEAVSDDRSLARAWLLAGWVHGGWHGQHAAWEKAAEQALTHYRLSGFPPATCLGQIAAALYYGPAPVREAIDRCERLLLEEGAGVIGAANVARYLGGLKAMSGEIDDGRALVDRATASLGELGQAGAAAYCDAIRADVEFLAGDAVAARLALERVSQYAQENEDAGLLATTAPSLAEALWMVGNYEAARHWVSLARTRVATTDLLAQIAWKSVAAKLLARDGSVAEAEELSNAAVSHARDTDALNARAATLIARADVLQMIGKPSEADDLVVQGIELYAAKGNLAAIERAKTLLGDRVTQ
jgi:DNA-binding SARP family transcriptional activator